MSTGADDLVVVAGQLADRARLLAEHAAAAPPIGSGLGAGALATEVPDAPDTVADLELVRLARELGTMARTALRLAVALAQADGHSWQQIGDVLEVSPQAACQRFGRPSEPADSELAPPVVADAADRAVIVLADWFEARYDAVVAAFDETLAGTFPVAGLAQARAHLTGRAGPYRRLGDTEPMVRQASDHTVADVPLEFEAGLLKGRVTFDRSGRVVGLYVLPPATP